MYIYIYTYIISRMPQLPPSPQEQVIAIGDLIFSALFALDVTVRLLVLGPRFFKVCMNYAPWHDLLENEKHLGVPKIGIPRNGWFIGKNPTKMDDLGVAHFRKPPLIESGMFINPRWPWPRCVQITSFSMSALDILRYGLVISNLGTAQLYLEMSPSSTAVGA